MPLHLKLMYASMLLNWEDYSCWYLEEQGRVYGFLTAFDANRMRGWFAYKYWIGERGLR